MKRLLLLPLLTASLYATDWYVAPNGNDDWTGRLPKPNADMTDGPFATLFKARDTIRPLPGARTVQLRTGVYELPYGLEFSAEDSGSVDAPVVWQAYENEKPVLIAGRSITGWKPWKDGILRADVGTQGFKGIAFKQLLFNGQRQILARYPNFDPKNPYGGGWAYADGVMSPMYVDKEGENNHTLKIKKSDWRKWARTDEVEVFVFPRYNWWNDILSVKSSDAASRTITTAADASFAMRANDRFYFQGALEELDAPGEWYLDRKTWTLYFKPPTPLEGATVYAPTANSILSITGGAKYITLRGLTFECSEGWAVSIYESSHNRIIGCSVRNVGGFDGCGIVVQEGADNGIIGCDISYIGRDGVSLGGGDRAALTDAKNFVDNCYIHHTGVFYKQGVAIALSGVGQRVSHCLIHDTPRFAIEFTGNNHVLEYNHMRHIALETEDVGATYCGGRDWISPRGSVIRYNFIHDVLGYGWNGKWTSPYLAWGIYLDDNSGGVDIIGNIVARCGRALMNGHSARDTRVENNIFVEGGLRQWEFNGWTTKHPFWIEHLPTMMKGYESVAQLPAWKSMRGMEVPPDKIADAEGRVMSGNVFTKNIIAWKNDGAHALNVDAFNPERNHFDHNLYWHHGKPMLTGIRKPGKAITENLVPNPGFANGELGKLPTDWDFHIRTPNAKAALVEDDGQRALRIDAAFDEAKKSDNFPIVASSEIELKPGAQYLLRARLRTDRKESDKVVLQVQFYVGPKDGKPGHFWGSTPYTAKVERTGKDFEFAFAIPKENEEGWHPEMKNFQVRLDWPEKQGALFASNISLQETEIRDEWQSWQELGDQHSVIADPKFLAPEKDDFRLAPDSPAFALGFKQIPVEKIGPYQSPDRASWPIIEAEGAREHPLSE
ncbi:hypothetical protein BH11VER1_BH11VER1_01450 [soil metagenome]